MWPLYRLRAATADRRTVRRRAALAALVGLVALSGAAPASAATPEWRGIIEGAYRTPWDHAARMRMLAWMPQHGLTSYIHAPKDDLYQRMLWRDPYPAARLADFSAEIKLARAGHVRWIPNLSPGIPLLPTPLPPGVEPSAPLCFSCPDDVDAVASKFAPFLDAGLRTVMVSFDDVAKQFGRSEDAAAFGSAPTTYGEATAYFLNSVYDALQRSWPGTELLTVPADYSGTRDTPYLQGLRAGLRPAVHVMWTGTLVRSTQWQASDAAAYSLLIGRKPIVWDNWTNNDFAVTAESDATTRVFLGPYTRPASVARSVAGWFFNPASEADLNMLPLATAADWLRNPWRFNPRASWLRAVDSLAGPSKQLIQPLRAWAEASYSTRLSRVEGPTFVRLTRQFLGAFDEGPYWTRALAALRGELNLARRARRSLAAMQNRAFFDQALPFLDATADNASAGVVGATLLEAERPSLSATRTKRGGFRVSVSPPSPGRAAMLRQLLAGWRTRLAVRDRLVYGWRRLGARAIPSYGARNVMDGFLAEVQSRDAAWQPLADHASGAVSITIDDRPGPAPVAGAVRLGGSNCGAIVVARDAAGGAASIRLPGCR
jgi:hyaluronoglucosaminidase